VRRPPSGLGLPLQDPSSQNRRLLQEPNGVKSSYLYHRTHLETRAIPLLLLLSHSMEPQNHLSQSSQCHLQAPLFTRTATSNHTHRHICLPIIPTTKMLMISIICNRSKLKTLTLQWQLLLSYLPPSENPIPNKHWLYESLRRFYTVTSP